MSVEKSHLALVSGIIEQVFETPATAVNGPGAWPAVKELTMTDRTCAWCGGPSERKHCSHWCRKQTFRATKETPEAKERRKMLHRDYFRRRRATPPHPAVVSLPGEEWRQVVGYEGVYEVSNLGRVKSLDRVTTSRYGVECAFRGKELKQTEHGTYFVVTISAGGRGRQRKVHQLVCEAFRGPYPTPEHQVRHLNGNGLDNRLENLAYGTAAENQQDSIRHGTQWQVRKTHCPQGHPYDEANTRHNQTEARNGRDCRACGRERARIERARKRAVA